MGLLKKATNDTAFAKIGIMGFNGAGKTFTAKEIAIGICNKIGAKQVAFFDTEKGSDFLVKPFEAAGIDLLTHKGRAFKDLIAIIKECESGGVPVLIIDSITHVWRDLCDSYQQQQKRRFLEMRDWGVLKKQWSEFTDLYINSKLHILMLGRAGDVYETEKDEVTGKNVMIKNGTKMRVETETGFEPDLLIEMERVWENDVLVNKAYVVKDRSNTMNGKEFTKPTFKSFESFFNYINLGGEHKGIDTTRNSKDIFDNPDYSAAELSRRREIALEKIAEAFVLVGLEGRSADVMKQKTEKLIKVFGTSSWTAISTMRATELERLIVDLRVELGLDKPVPKIEVEGEIK